MWAAYISQALYEHVQVAVRTESAAALGAALTWRSPAALLNDVAKEFSADAAAGLFVLDVVEHVRGLANNWADALSHLHVPEELGASGASRSQAPVPRGAFWTARALPPV